MSTEPTADERAMTRPWRKRIVQIGVSIACCFFLYRAADWRIVFAAIASLDVALMVAAAALFVPQTFLSAWRWKCLMAAVAPLSIATATKHTLAASALNLVIPSKLGDLSKAAFAPVAAGTDRRRAAMLVGYEKGTDLAAIAIAMLLGRWAWGAMNLGLACVAAAIASYGALQWLRRRSRLTNWIPSRMVAVALLTSLLWTMHLAQIHCFLLAAGVSTDWPTTAARVPAALLAGVLPAAFCGVGTRDAALVWLYADAAPAATMVVVGLLTALRYVVPGAIGIPLLIQLRRSTPATHDPIARSSSRRPTLRRRTSSATR